MPSSEAVARQVRVAFLLQDFTMGGIAQWIYTVCREVHRTHPGTFDFHFIATHGWVIQPRFAEIGTPEFLGREGRAPGWWTWRRVTRHLRRLAPDIIQFSNLAAYRDVCLKVRPPVIIERKAGMRTLRRYDLTGVDAVISQNQEVHEAIALPPDRKFLVYHGVDVDACRAVAPDRLGFAPEDFVIGQASRLGRGQNHELLIDAVIALRARHPRVKLVLVGGTTPQPGAVDELPRLRERARPLGDAVRFTGPVENPFPLIAGFDVATCTSTREFTEGAPRKLIEPMGFGIPCVTTDSGATREVVEDGVNGFVIEDDDRAALADRLERLLVDRALYDRLAAEARRTVERRFNIVTQAALVREAYLALLARAGRKGRT